VADGEAGGRTAAGWTLAGGAAGGWVDGEGGAAWMGCDEVRGGLGRGLGEGGYGLGDGDGLGGQGRHSPRTRQTTSIGHGLQQPALAGDAEYAAAGDANPRARSTTPSMIATKRATRCIPDPNVDFCAGVPHTTL